MSTDSAIEWTDATWNPVVGCTRVSAGCDHCYAVSMTRRLEGMAKAPGLGGRKQNYAGLTVLNPRGDRHFNGVVRCVEEALDVPLRWKQPRRIFVNSMSDLFHPKVPFEFIDRVFAVMALCPQHTFQVLTKRPERMAEYFGPVHTMTLSRVGRVGNAMRDVGGDVPIRVFASVERREGVPNWPLPNVWLGTSCENQAAADERIPHLLRCPAAVRFLSCEPLLGPLDIQSSGALGAAEAHEARRLNAVGRDHVDWVIVGGESGPKARSCDVDWIRSIVEQCRAAGVPCFVKQLGAAAWDPRIAGFDSSIEEMQPEHLNVNGRKLRDAKGGDPSEWPQHLRVREWPSQNHPGGAT